MKTQKNGTKSGKNRVRKQPSNGRFDGIERPYSREDVERLRGTIQIEHTLARRGAEKLWDLHHMDDFVAALGALTDNQAVQQVKAGLKAIYLSGWQVAADANLAGQMYPDQSLYPANSVPAIIRRINNALLRADQIDHADSETNASPARRIDWLVPIVADAEAGFGGPLNVFELIKAMIEAGAAGVHLEGDFASDQLCAVCGFDLVRNEYSRPGRRETLCRSGKEEVPRQAAGLQLLAVVQLETKARPGNHREISA